MGKLLGKKKELGMGERFDLLRHRYGFGGRLDFSRRAGPILERLDFDRDATLLLDMMNGRRAVIARDNPVDEFSFGIARDIAKLRHGAPKIDPKKTKASRVACLRSLFDN
ncbi:MAG: hypothetical protein V4710_00895 [Verrucomicrobiota bacterium]